MYCSNCFDIFSQICIWKLYFSHRHVVFSPVLCNGFYDNKNEELSGLSPVSPSINAGYLSSKHTKY